MSPIKVIENADASISAVSTDNGSMVLVVETGSETHEYDATPGTLIQVPIQVDCGYTIEKTEPVCECPITEQVTNHYNIPFHPTMIVVGVLGIFIGYMIARIFRRH